MPIEDAIRQYLKQTSDYTSTREYLYDPTVSLGKSEHDNYLANVIGSSLWEALDTAGFGIPGYVAKKAGWEPPEAESRIARAAGAIAGTAAFMVGPTAPIKVASEVVNLGARAAARLLGKQTIKMAARGFEETLVGAGFRSEIASKVSQKLGGILSNVGHRARWKETLLDPQNFSRRIGMEVERALGEFASVNRLGLNASEWEAIRKILKEQTFQRPVQELTDIISMAIPKMWGGKPIGSIIGASVNEAMKFAFIDSIMEKSRSATDGTEYDWMAPVMGGTVGALFGQLHWLAPVGKATITGHDMRVGIKGILMRNPYKNMSGETLGKLGEMLGRDIEASRGAQSKDLIYYFRHPKLKGGVYALDLRGASSAWESVAQDAGVDVADKMLRDALNTKRVQLGRQLIQWAAKEDISSSVQNWKRMLFGTMFMNIHTLEQIYHGQPIDSQDLMTNILIGAFLNRRGEAADYDMNVVGRDMKALRSHLYTLGLDKPIDKFGLKYDHPSISDPRYSHINPLNDPLFDKIKDLGLEELFVDDYRALFDKENAPSLETTIRSLRASEHDLRIFEETMQFFAGARGKFWKGDLITVDQALKVQNEIMKLEYDGTKLNDIHNVRKAFRDIIGRSTDKFQEHFRAALHEITGIINERPVDRVSDIPKIAKDFEIPADVRDQVEAGKITDSKGEVITTDRLNEVVGKLRHMMSWGDGLDIIQLEEGKSTQISNTKNTSTGAYGMDKIRNLIDAIEKHEKIIDSKFPSNDNMQFSFNAMGEVGFAMAMRRESQGLKVAKEILKSSYPRSNELRERLVKIGVMHQSEEPGILGIINKESRIDYVLPEDEAGQTARIDRARAFMRYIVGGSNAVRDKYTRVDTSDSRIKVKVADVEELMEWVSSQGLPLKGEDYKMLTSIVIKNALEENIAESDLRAAETNMIGAMLDLTILGDKPLAIFTNPTEGATSIALQKVELIGGAADESSRDIVNTFNRMSEAIVKRGQSKTGSSVVSFTNDVATIGVVEARTSMAAAVKIMEQAAIDAGKSYASNLENIIDAIQTGKSSMLMSLKKFINDNQFHDSATNLLRVEQFMISEGVDISYKDEVARERAIETLKQKLKSGSFYDKLKRVLERVGVREPEIKQLLDEQTRLMNQQLDVQMAMTEALHRQNDQQFFSEYIPSLNTAEKRRKFEGDLKNPDETFREDAEDLVFKEVLREATPERAIELNIEGSSARIKTLDAITKWKNTKSNKTTDTVLNVLRSSVHEVVENGAEFDKLHQINEAIGRLFNAKVVIYTKDVEATKLNEGGTTIWEDDYGDRILRTYRINMKMSDYIPEGDKWVDEYYDLSDYMSPHISDAARSFLANKWKAFENLMENHTPQVKYGDDPEIKGIAMIGLGKIQKVIGIAKADHAMIRNAFKELILKRYGDDPIIGKDIKDIDKVLDSSEMWTEEHTRAYRLIVYSEMGLGSDGQDLFRSSWAKGDAETLAGIAKRVGHVDAPSVKFYTPERIRSIHSSRRKFVQKYIDNPMVRTVVYNDDARATIVWKIANMRGIPYAEAMKEFKALTGRGKDVSRLDSQTFISKDLLDFAIAMGGEVENINGITVLKPLISSTGVNSLLLMGKTEFVYMPEMEPFLKGSGVDMLMMASADKLKAISTPERRNQFDPKGNRPEEELIARFGSRTSLDEPENFFDSYNAQKGLKMQMAAFEIPIDSIGFTKIIHPEAAAVMSSSLFSYTDPETGKLIYDTYWRDKVEFGINSMIYNMEDLGRKNLYIRNKTEVSEGELGSDLTAGAEAHSIASWLASLTNAPATNLIISDNAYRNMLMNDFLGAAMRPQAITNGAKTQFIRHGGQAALSQTLGRKSREMKWTSVDGTEYGEVYLPNWSADESIQFGNKNIDLWVQVRLSDGKTKDVKWTEFYNNYITDKAFKDKYGDGVESLGDAFQLLEIFNEVNNTDNALLAQVVRYPRTKPIDMIFLRVKGFNGREMRNRVLERLPGRYGNDITINDVDVLRIFEGDYDIDMAHFFWGTDAATVKHMTEMRKERMLAGVDAEASTKMLTQLSMLDGNVQNENAKWLQHEHDLRHLKKNIGRVQKTNRLLNHIDSMASEKTEMVFNATTGKTEERKVRKILGRDWAIAGQPTFIEVDFRNVPANQRFALESQELIDYFAGIPASVRSSADWRYDFMFPIMEKSKSSEDYERTKFPVGFRPNTEFKPASSPGDTRVRIFRKWTMKDGRYEEVDLTNFDKEVIIQSYINPYSDFLQLSTNVFSDSGVGRNPTYNDVITKTRKYADHLSGVNKVAFKLQQWIKEQDNAGSDEFTAMFGRVESELTPKAKYTKGKVEARGKVFYEHLGDRIRYVTRSPFEQATIDKGAKIVAGKEGHPNDLMYMEILRADDRIRSADRETHQVMGDQRATFEAYISAMLGAQDLADVDHLTRITPAVVSDFNTAKWEMQKLLGKRKWARDEARLSADARAKLLEQIERDIQKRWEVLEPFFNNRTPENIDPNELRKMNIEQVSIRSKSEYMEAFAQHFAIAALRVRYTSGGVVMSKKASEVRKTIARLLFGPEYKYGEKTHLDSEKMDEMFRFPRSEDETRERIYEEIEKAYVDAGPGTSNGLRMLNELLTPNAENNIIGILEGRVFPIPEKPNFMFRHVLTMLKRRIDRNNEAISNSGNKDVISQENEVITEYVTSLVESFAAADALVRNQFDYVPREIINQYNLNGKDFQKLLNLPEWGSAMQKVFDRYTDRKWLREVVGGNSMGMGPEYSRMVDLLRIIASTEGEKKGVEAFSYILELELSNGYIHPLAMAQLMNDVKKQLVDSGMLRKFTDTYGSDGTKEFVKSLSNISSIGALIAGDIDNPGFGVHPLLGLSDARLRTLKRLMAASKAVNSINMESATKRALREEEYRRCEF